MLTSICAVGICLILTITSLHFGYLIGKGSIVLPTLKPDDDSEIEDPVTMEDQAIFRKFESKEIVGGEIDED